MALTLGTLRTFCREIASPDSSGSTAEREFMVWINGAIERVFSAAGWDQILHQQKVTVLPRETLDTFAVTLGSRTVTCVAADSFLPGASTKYLDERWELHIEGETDEAFEFSAIASATSGTLRAGDEWTGATASGLDVYFVKTIYTLPNVAKQITRVQVLETGLDLLLLQPADFDFQKSSSPTQTGGYPRFATFRKNALEIYPHPGDSYCKIGITYRKGPTVLADADADATEIDWPDEWRDLLTKAITLEAAITQGENAPTPYIIALAEYERRLAAYKALDSNRDPMTGPLGVGDPIPPAPFGTPAWSYTGPWQG